MSETPTPAAEPDGAAEGAEIPVAATEPAPDGSDIDPQDQRLSAEAARWRREFRSAEAKLTAADTQLTIAQARIAELQRAEIDRAVATKLASADDLWLWPGVNLDQFITDGEVDLEAVNAKADEIITARPHWKAHLAPVGAPSAAVQGDGRYNVPGAAQPTWEGLLKGKTAG